MLLVVREPVIGFELQHENEEPSSEAFGVSRTGMEDQGCLAPLVRPVAGASKR